MDYWTKYGEDLRSSPEAQEAQRALREAWDDRKWIEERSLPEGCEPITDEPPRREIHIPRPIWIG